MLSLDKLKMGRISFIKNSEDSKFKYTLFIKLVLIFISLILIIDLSMKMVFYFRGPIGGYLLHKNTPNVWQHGKPILHTGLTALQIISGPDDSPNVGLWLLVLEASIAMYLILRFLIQNYSLAYTGRKNKDYLLSLQLGRRKTQHISYIIVLLCLLSSVVDRCYTHAVDCPKHHQFAIIDWIYIKNIIVFNLTDVTLLVLAIFILINFTYVWIEKGIKWILIRSEK